MAASSSWRLVFASCSAAASACARVASRSFAMSSSSAAMSGVLIRPAHLDLDRERGLTIEWADGSRSFYTIDYLRQMSPSADARELREQMSSNPLAVIPAALANSGAVTALDAELVGHYAIRIRFSDGHDTGIYSWQYLKEIECASP